MTKKSLIQLKNVTKNYQMGDVTVHALRDMNLEITAGEFIVLLGPSGSGKTTTLNVIGGLDRPTDGSIFVQGEDITSYNNKELTRYRRQKMGFVFQFFNLIPTLTASENVEFALTLVEKDGRRLQEKARDLLGMVGLVDRADHFPSQLSGGEQQRVAIARALANQPPVVLCDEPTGNLDVETGQRVLQVMRELNRQKNTTIVLVTHNSAIAPMADRVVHLHNGSIAQISTNPHPAPVSELTW
ncbi:MAG: ABC transporter ATP-binding protein [Chloroflexi bacterium]|nr:ABC transporter ATP-binding protein [Chloroflexota bacterium]